MSERLYIFDTTLRDGEQVHAVEGAGEEDGLGVAGEGKDDHPGKAKC